MPPPDDDRRPAAERVSVSTVTPVYRGQDYLGRLVDELAALRSEWEQSGAPLELREAVFVDDSALDDSPRLLAELAAEHDWIRVVTLARNFGQHPATIAGILHTSGDFVVTLDEDLQHPPRDIPTLLGVLAREGADVVYAKPVGRVHGWGYRDLSSRLFKRLLVLLTGNPVIQQFNSFRLIRGSVARAAASLCGHETYLDVAFSWFTNRFQPIELELVDDRHQQGGQSGYSFRSLLSHARRMILSSQTRLLRAGALLGAFAMLIAVGLGGSVVLRKLQDPSFVDVRGWTSLFSAIMFFGGICTLLSGITLEYVSSVVLHTQGKPTFFAVDRSPDRVLLAHFQALEAAPPPAA